jgi:hypothetical protein
MKGNADWPDTAELRAHQLIKAANLKDRIEALTKELNALLGSSPASTTAKPAKKGMSAAGRAKVAAAQKARWAKIKAAKNKTAPKTIVAKPVKAKMSAAAKAKLSALMKARWAAKKAAKK